MCCVLAFNVSFKLYVVLLYDSLMADKLFVPVSNETKRIAFML